MNAFKYLGVIVQNQKVLTFAKNQPWHKLPSFLFWKGKDYRKLFKWVSTLYINDQEHEPRPYSNFGSFAKSFKTKSFYKVKGIQLLGSNWQNYC